MRPRNSVRHDAESRSKSSADKTTDLFEARPSLISASMRPTPQPRLVHKIAVPDKHFFVAVEAQSVGHERAVLRKARRRDPHRRVLALDLACIPRQQLLC